MAVRMRNNGFDWELYPETEDFLMKQTDEFLAKNKVALSISDRMIEATSTRFFDWIDSLLLPKQNIHLDGLESFGYAEDQETSSRGDRIIYRHPESIFPPIVVHQGQMTEIWVKPENLSDFVQMLGGGKKISGELHSAFRKVLVSEENDTRLCAVERRGFNGFAAREDNDDLAAYRECLELFQTRLRHFSNKEDGIEHLHSLVQTCLKNLSKDRVADAFFRSERMYWQNMDKAGRVQKARQDRLGLGWGNHDHHTYRSSRAVFVELTALFESLGMIPREHFFAGEKAGWGAQIFEHPVCNIVVFADIDISEAERDIDFAHRPLAEKDELGTVGLWTSLHGESILKAGMHHLAVRLDFEKAIQDLKEYNLATMRPFSDFDFLKQAFTESERRSITEKNLKDLLKRNSINKDKYETFRRTGAIGSHLENIQRGEGFKGFNQDSVTAIIKETDPRRRGPTAA